MSDRILRRREVEAMIGITERQIRTLEAEGKFPRRFLISEGGRAVGWSANEVAEWLADRIARREQPSKTGMAGPGQRIGATA